MKLKMSFLKILSFILIFVPISLAQTPQSRATLEEIYFADGQAAGSITPSRMRDFVRSIVPETKTQGYFLRFGAGGVPEAVANPMTYPTAGIPVSSGSAWGTSLTAPSGALVGTTDAQDLTNKTLTMPIVRGYTVATLPTAGTAGRVAAVTDASVAGNCATGGGSALALCRDSGSEWVSIGDGGSSSGGGLDNPMTTSQDIIVGGTSGTPTRLAAGVEGKYLRITSGVVAWSDPEAGSAAATFESSTTWTFTGENHGLGTCDLSVSSYYVESGELIDIKPNRISCVTTAGATQYNVIVTWAVAQAGRLVLIAGGGSGSGSSGGGEDTTSVSNSGAGAAVLKTGTNVEARTLVAGSNVTITQNVDTISISSASGGGVPEIDETLTGAGTVEDPLGVNPALIPMFMKVSATINDWGTIAANSCQVKTFAFSGAFVNDSVSGARPPSISTNLTVDFFVGAMDEMTVQICNGTGSGIAVADGIQFGATIVRGL